MPLIHRRTVAIVAITIGLPMFIIGCEGDKANAAPPAAKCNIEVNYPNITLPRNGWFGYLASWNCQNYDPDSVRVTFRILKNDVQYDVMHTRTSPIQFTTRCRKGGKVAEFRPHIRITVNDAAGKRRVFTKLGPVYHWRCLKR